MSTSVLIRETRSLIDIILGRNAVPLSVFESLVLLASNPNNLVAFAHKDLIASCVSILCTRTGVRPANQPATYELACLRVLAIALLVLLLGAEVDTFIDSAIKEKEEGARYLTSLGQYASYLQLRGMGYTKYMSEQNAGVPGMTDKDAECLIELMYSQRSVMLAALVKCPTAWQGFASLLYILCQRLKAIDDKRITLHLWDLLCRFALISHGAEPNEDILLCSAIDDISIPYIRELNPHECGPVDYADMQTIVKCYARRMAPRSGQTPLPLNSCTMLLRWICSGPWKIIDSSQHLFLPCIEATILRLWIDLEDPGEVDPMHGVVKSASIIEIFTGVMNFMSNHLVKEEDKSRLIQIFLDGDFVNLIGRVLFVFALDEPSVESVGTIEDMMYMIQTKRKLVCVGADAIVARWSPSRDLYNTMAYDWLNGFELIQILRGLHTRRDGIYKEYLFQCNTEWVELGMALGFTKRLEHNQRLCAYPRCTAAHWGYLVKACGRCGDTRYCSLRCQQAHWEYPTEPHIQDCLKR